MDGIGSKALGTGSKVGYGLSRIKAVEIRWIVPDTILEIRFGTSDPATRWGKDTRVLAPLENQRFRVPQG